MSSVRRTGSDHRITDALILGAGSVTLGVAYVPGVSTWLLSHGSTCPLQRAVGWQCPFCGMTRGTIALLHGDLGEVLRRNPFAIIYVIGLALMVASVLGFSPRSLFDRDRRGLDRAAAVSGLLMFATFSLVRNII